MSQVINISDTISAHPSSFDSSNSSYASVDSSHPIENGYEDSSSTTYAQFVLTTGRNAETYIYYNFDFSEIPTDATISSLSCTAKGYVSSTSSRYISTRQMQLCTGTTAMGSSVTLSNSASAQTITTGTWTVAQLKNAKIRLYVTRGTSSTTSTNYYCRFYGATFSVTYSFQGTQYTLTATSDVDGVSVDPVAATATNGESQTFTIVPDNLTIDDFVVKDNDVDVTENLASQQIGGNGSVSKTATDFTTGFSGGSNMQFYTSSSSTGTNFSYAVGHTAESPGSTSSGSGTWTYVKDNGSSTSYTGYGDFSFDFSDIPINATITSVEVKCYGAVEDSSQTTSHSDITLYSGSTQKGTTQSFTSSTNSIITLSNVGSWTRAELQSAKLRFTVGYYGGHLFGITWNVSYTAPVTTIYTYTLTNIAADHEIVIESPGGAYIPPTEDPTKNYFPITISSINATTSPRNGSTRVEEGTNQTITITPSDPQLTLALDNGVDITSQLSGGVPDNSYTVATASGASYGFTLNNSTGYYTSQNKGVANSAAVARVTFTLETACTVTFSYINYAESTYDYGIFGRIDTALGTTYSADSNPYLSCSASSYNTANVQTLTYEMSAGTHYIDVKFRKDSSTNSNNDTLQFKVELQATGTSGDYTYTLTNIDRKHSLIFIFGNVSYYFINSSGNNAKLYPDGQIVVLQGNNYKLAIVPNDDQATVTVLDNGTDVTNSLTFEEGYDNDNNRIVNYTYILSNVGAAHEITVTSVSAGQKTLYIKINGTWTPCSKVYKKINGSWVEQANTDWTTVLPTNVEYRTIIER